MALATFGLTSCQRENYGEAHFDRDVLPLLEERCFSCHGADESTRRADLRLDLKNRAVVSGNVKESRIVTLIESGHPQGGEAWTTSELRSLKAWIKEGATYPAHWLYRMDEAGSSEWPAGLIEEEDPADSEAAGRWFDQMYARFSDGEALASTRDVFLARYAQDQFAAKALIIDELLQGNKYGEVMAGVWIDLLGDQEVQTAEDYAPYRAWLVNAFNDDLPLTEMIQSQLAADFVEGSDLVPTGFLRTWGSDGASARVALIGRLFFGEESVETRVLSRQQRQQISALFTCESDEARQTNPRLRDPVMRSPSAQNVADFGQLKEMFTQLNSEKAAVVKAGEERAGTWLAMNPGFVAVDGGVAIYDFNDDQNLLKNSALQSAGSAKMEQAHPEKGLSGLGVRVQDVNPLAIDVPVGTFAGWPWSISFWAAVPEKAKEDRVLLQKGIAGGREIRLEILADGRLALNFGMGEGEFAARYITAQAFKEGEWQHVALVYEGGMSEGDLKIYLDGLPVKTTYQPGERCYWPLNQEASKQPWVFGMKGQGAFLDEVQFFVRGLSGLEVAHVFSGRSLNAALADPVKWRPALNEFYLSSQDAGMQKWRQKKAGIYQYQQKIEESVPEIPVMRRPLGQTIPNPLLVVDPTRYAVPIPSEAMESRLAFSRWVVSGDSILVNRVLANAFLKVYLGETFLPTAAEREAYRMPARLETLDAAVRFLEAHDWSTKAFCREILIKGKLAGAQ